MKSEEKGLISGSTLKFIALFTMLIDHAAAASLFPAVTGGTVLYHACRMIGRISFPLFCFLLVEGFIYSHDRFRYWKRLLLFAIFSEIPFDLAFYHQMISFRMQNVFFTLFLGMSALWGIEWLMQKERYQQILIPPLLCAFLAWILRTDYSYFGIFLIVVLYCFRDFPGKRDIIMAASVVLWEPTAILALIPIHLYNGKRGLPLKYVFYLFYPAHLLLFWRLRGVIY